MTFQTTPQKLLSARQAFSEAEIELTPIQSNCLVSTAISLNRIDQVILLEDINNSPAFKDENQLKLAEIIKETYGGLIDA